MLQTPLQPMHHYVEMILDTAKMQKDKFVVPATTLYYFSKQLRSQHMGDKSLFAHLAAAAKYVKASGLLALAEQLSRLAQIGLSETEERVVTRISRGTKSVLRTRK